MRSYISGGHSDVARDRSNVLEDAASNFTDLNNTDIGIAQALAADDEGSTIQRHIIRRQRDVCDAGHFND